MKRTIARSTRRQFLIGMGATAAWLAAGCGRRARDTTPAPVGTSAPAATAAPTATRAAATAGAATAPPATAAATAGAPPGGPADLILRGGKVITVDSADTIAQAVAVKDGLIQAVGRDDEIAAYAGAGTQTIDLAGRALTPGLIDPHNHFQLMGLMGTFYTPFLPPDIRSIRDLQDAIAALVAQTPAGEWIKGYYLAFSDGRVPNRKDIDPVAPDTPVWIMQQGGHFGFANSCALEIAGITAATANPTGGIIERDAGGEPTGVFYNHRAMDLLRKFMPLYTIDVVRDNIASTQSLFAACGVTTFHDNNVRGTDVIGAYLDTGREGRMYLRGSVYYTLEWPQDLQRALNEVQRYDDAYMRMAGFKFLIDGQAPTAYCHAPHNGVSWDIPTWDPQNFRDTVRALHDTGLQICVHCAGDAAVDLVLDAYEAAMNANPRPDPRHRIEHAVLTTPDSTRRMKDLGVVVSTQPQFIRIGGNTYTSLFGAERVSRILVTREWLNNDVHVALGSDAPTTPWYTPQITLAGAVSRVTMTNEVLGPEQCLTIQEALRAHTMGGAYAGHEEHVKGSIEAGKYADLVVWHGDPYGMTVGQLAQATIDVTLVGGKIVHQA